MSALPTNYVDAVLDATANTRRKYNLIDNGDGTVSLEDVTVYTTEGSEFSAGDINNTNNTINQLVADEEQTNNNLSQLNSNFTQLKNKLQTTYNGQTIPFEFGIDANGNYGYRKAGAATVTPFRNAKLIGTFTQNSSVNVAGLGATSAAEFVMVPSSSNTNSGFRRWATGGNWTLTVDVYPGGLSLSGNTLTINIPWAYAYSNSGNSEEGLMRVSTGFPVKVYHIGKQ